MTGKQNRKWDQDTNGIFWRQKSRTKTLRIKITGKGKVWRKEKLRGISSTKGIQYFHDEDSDTRLKDQDIIEFCVGKNRCKGGEIRGEKKQRIMWI